MFSFISIYFKPSSRDFDALVEHRKQRWNWNYSVERFSNVHNSWGFQDCRLLTNANGVAGRTSKYFCFRNRRRQSKIGIRNFPTSDTDPMIAFPSWLFQYNYHFFTNILQLKMPSCRITLLPNSVFKRLNLWPWELAVAGSFIVNLFNLNEEYDSPKPLLALFQKIDWYRISLFANSVLVESWAFYGFMNNCRGLGASRGGGEVEWLTGVYEWLPVIS